MIHDRWRAAIRWLACAVSAQGGNRKVRSDSLSETTNSRRHNRWLELIAVYKLLQALLLISVGFGALKLMHKDTADVLANLVTEMRFHTDGRLISFLLDRAAAVDDPMLRRISVFVFVYAALGLVEGIGLLLEKLWAEYLTAVITASFLPLEILEVFHRVTAFRLGLFVANLAVLVYLVGHLHSQRPGFRSNGARSESSK